MKCRKGSVACHRHPSDLLPVREELTDFVLVPVSDPVNVDVSDGVLVSVSVAVSVAVLVFDVELTQLAHLEPELFHQNGPRPHSAANTCLCQT